MGKSRPFLSAPDRTLDGSCQNVVDELSISLPRKSMSRRTRRQERLLKEQNTVGMQRAERKEQEELAGRKKVEGARTSAQRMVSPQERKSEIDARPRRIARVGKPLKR